MVDESSLNSGEPKWQPAEERQLESDAYHIWKPRPLLRSVNWKPVPEPPRHAAAGAYDVFVDQRAFVSMHEHVWGAPADDEPFGFLVGDLCEDAESNRRYVLVSAAIPSPFPLRETAREQIPGEALVKLQLEVDRRRGVLAGWYHRHRGGPCELSEADAASHEKHFPEPWHVAFLFVTDPGQPEGGSFRRTRGGFSGKLTLPFYEMVTNESLLPKGVRRSRIDWRNLVTHDPIEVDAPPRPEPPPGSEERRLELDRREEAGKPDALLRAEPDLASVASPVEGGTAGSEVEGGAPGVEGGAPGVAAAAPESGTRTFSQEEPAPTSEGDGWESPSSTVTAPEGAGTERAPAEEGESQFVESDEFMTGLADLMPDLRETTAEPAPGSGPIGVAADVTPPVLDLGEPSRSGTGSGVGEGAGTSVETPPLPGLDSGIDDDTEVVAGIHLTDFEHAPAEADVSTSQTSEALAETEEDGSPSEESRAVADFQEWYVAAPEPEAESEVGFAAQRETELPSGPRATAAEQEEQHRTFELAADSEPPEEQDRGAEGELGGHPGSPEVPTGAMEHEFDFEALVAEVEEADVRGQVTESAAPVAEPPRVAEHGTLGAEPIVEPEPVPTKVGSQESPAAGGRPAAPAAAAVAPRVVTPRPRKAPPKERRLPVREMVLAAGGFVVVAAVITSLVTFVRQPTAGFLGGEATAELGSELAAEPGPDAAGGAVSDPTAQTEGLEAAGPITAEQLDALGDGLLETISRYYGLAVAVEEGRATCAELAAALVEVDDHWIEYNVRGKSRFEGPIPAELAERDERLYQGVRDVEREFRRSGCRRP